jgi:hypothetical protein
MIKVENIKTHGFFNAIRAARNPMSSWSKSDTLYWPDGTPREDWFLLRKDGNDIDLFHRLYVAGVEHRTYARMIFVWMDITAPLYWWKEMDRYTIGKSQVSTSTMHKIHAKEFELDDFSHEHLTKGLSSLKATIDILNIARKSFLETKSKEDWWQMIQLLPSSYNQRRSICMSYEVVFKIIHERTGHKLDEWQTMVDILKDLPYVKEIMGE